MPGGAGVRRDKMEAKSVQGVQVGGREPKALLLSDGTRLSLEEDIGPGGRADWTRVGDDGSGADGLSVADALQVAGDEYADYVRVRTRAEIAWLRLVSEWFDEEADRLDRDLAKANGG
jgi:hypothetical protein